MADTSPERSRKRSKWDDPVGSERPSRDRDDRRDDRRDRDRDRDHDRSRGGSHSSRWDDRRPDRADKRSRSPPRRSRSPSARSSGTPGTEAKKTVDPAAAAGKPSSGTWCQT